MSSRLRPSPEPGPGASRPGPRPQTRRPGRRRGLARWAAALTAALAATGLGCSDPPRPNLVLLVIDTLRADKLGSYGFELPTSPELDAHAGRGVRFAQVVAPSSWTRPSMGSLLTSLHPRTLGIYDERRHALADSFVTLPELLQEAGYTTLGATGNPNINSAYNFQQGFDHYLDSDVLWPWMPAEPGKKRGYEHPMARAPQLFAALTAEIDARPAPPHYLQVLLMEVHGAFSPGVVRAPFDQRFDGHRESAYLQAIAQLSHDIEVFVRELSARPGFEDTLFVVTSDHGQGLFDHPSVPDSRLHGQLLYESHALVPLILWDTAGRLPAGRVVERPVRLLDLAPTLLDYAGLDVPGAMQGRSLLPLLRGEDPGLPDLFVVETQYRDRDKIAAYRGPWRFIVNRDAHPGVNPEELQPAGIVADGRRTDVAAEHPQLAHELADALAAWERVHPRAAPTPQRRAPGQAELEQLRALGYLQ